MSKCEILAELPKLSIEDRRHIAAAIFEMEEDALVLRECDLLAERRFLDLDAMESQDAKTQPS